MLFFIKKLRKLLSRWEGKLLSLAGRVTLAKSILQSIPNYFMQSTLIPLGVCKEVEKLIRQFIWGSSNISRKTTLVGWEKCCLPLDQEGLRLKRTQYQNKAFLLKLGFNFLLQKDALWVRILKLKYKIDEDCLQNIERRCCNFTWKSILSVWADLQSSLFWRVGDDRRVRFWTDH
ncbi:hypothetical protein V6Z12_A13G192300 [Gossypium hirsutum]